MPALDSRMGLHRVPSGVLLLAPAALGLITALHHEWWRDEAHTWLVVRLSPTFGSLFPNLGHSGHPWPYYMLVWALCRIRDDPFVLALVNLALALGASAFVFASAPLSRLQALLFSLGFFPLYQFGVIVRTYSLMLFVLFAYCHLRARRPANVAGRLLLLAALAQIHLISMAAAGLLLAFEWIERRRSGRAWTAREWASAAVVVASLALVSWEIAPRTGGVAESDMAGSPRALLWGLADGFVPGWGIIALSRTQLLFGLGLWLSGLAIFWGRWRALLLYLALAAPIAFISLGVYATTRWHHGLYFVYLVPALWIAGGGALAGWKARVLTVMLVVQAGVGVYAMAEDFLRPYSGGEALVRYRDANGLADLPLVGMYVYQKPDGAFQYRFEVDQIQPVLLASPGAQTYDPNASAFVPLQRRYFDPGYFPLQDLGAIYAALSTLAERIPAPFLIVLSRNPGVAPIELPPPIRRLGEFPGLDFGETYGLYLWPAP